MLMNKYLQNFDVNLNLMKSKNCKKEQNNDAILVTTI